MTQISLNKLFSLFSSEILKHIWHKEYIPWTKTGVLKDGELVKEGKVVGLGKKVMGNTSDIVIAKAEKSDKLYQGRFSCSQCHAPQAKIDTLVGNTFQPDGLTDELKSGSSLADAMNEGVE